MRPLGMSMSNRSSEANEESIGTKFGVLILMVRITGVPCREGGANSRSEGIGVLDLSNNPDSSVFVIASGAKGDGGRLREEFSLDSSSLRLCGLECTQEEYRMGTEIVLYKEGSVLSGLRLGLR